jgi:hypothetical protein
MKNQILALTTVVLSLAGCLQKVTEVPGLDRVMTVGEFNAQPALRDRILKFCANDPGKLRGDPNCVNVIQAARTSTFGTGNFPRLDMSPPPSMTGKK